MRLMGAAERAWLRDHYADGDIHDTLDAFEAAFGWRPNPHTVYTNAYRLGLRKRRIPPEERGRRVEVMVRWSREPEMSAWMAERDTGSYLQTAKGFEERFGVLLTRGQVNQWRASHGTQHRPSHGGGAHRRPIGFERRTKGGILVKVAEEPTVPMSKDNWRFKHVLAYEREHGPLPDGWVVMCVDGDPENCDPANLVAAPRRVIGAINQMAHEKGRTWETREELLATIELEALGIAINDAEHRQPRRCGVCGRTFYETEAQRKYGKRVQTCPDCCAAGHKSKGKRTYKRRDGGEPPSPFPGNGS